MDPEQVTQVFNRCPGCRTVVSPTDASCPGCGRSLADAVERTMPLPRLDVAAPPHPEGARPPQTTQPIPSALPVEPVVYTVPPPPVRRGAGFPLGLLLVPLVVALGVLGYLALPTRGNQVAAVPGPTPNAAAGAAAQQWIVANTGGEGVFLRRSPRLDDRLVAWPDNTPMQDLGEEAAGDGLTWRKVRDPRGNVGYVPTKWLAARP